MGWLFALVAVSGATMAFQLTSLQALAGEIAGPERLTSAISIMSFGQRAIGAIGALTSGMLLAVVGPSATFFVAAMAMLIASAVFASVPAPRRQAATGAFAADVLEGLRLVFRVPMVALLLGLMVCAEILGFSYNSLLPVIAEERLDVGPEGLGALVSAAAVGAMAGTAALTLGADRIRRGMLLLLVVGLFGAMLTVLAGSHVFVLSLLVVATIGAAAATIDALEWVLLQASVDERLRGRALGVWNLAIGWGWIGPIAVGAAAAAAGLSIALSVSGTLLLLIALLAGLRFPILRRA